MNEQVKIIVLPRDGLVWAWCMACDWHVHLI